MPNPCCKVCGRPNTWTLLCSPCLEWYQRIADQFELHRLLARIDPLAFKWSYNKEEERETDAEAVAYDVFEPLWRAFLKGAHTYGPRRAHQ